VNNYCKTETTAQLPRIPLDAAVWLHQ